jgi:hypothetical protein
METMKAPLHIKPTCYGCGMIAKIGCGFNPLRDSDQTGRAFTKCKGDSLVDLNDDHQFTISLPVVTKGKNFDKASAKQVTFNSIRCANLTLLNMFGANAADLGEFRASQGYRRCPTCRSISYKGDQFCNEVCKEQFDGPVEAILEVAAQVQPGQIRRCKSGRKCLRFADRKPAPAKGKSPYCGSNCGASDRARGKRVIPGLAAASNGSQTPVNIGDF